MGSLDELIVDPANGDRAFGYTYDPFGNRLTKSDSVDGSTTYGYDANDRLVSEARPDGLYAYTYDSNGNTLSESGPGVSKVYGWSPENRLISFDDGTNAVAYGYADDGLRVSKSVNGESVGYLVDRNRPYGQVLREVDSSGAELASYVHGSDLVSMARPESGASWYLVDGQMSTRALVDGAGAVTDQYTYDAWGVGLAESGGMENTYRYNGEQLDKNGHYYLRARYLNHVSGRFIGQDKYLASIRLPMSQNRYIYAGSSPVDNNDPGGENFSLIEMGIALGALTAIINCHSNNIVTGTAVRCSKEDILNRIFFKYDDAYREYLEKSPRKGYFKELGDFAKSCAKMEFEWSWSCYDYAEDLVFYFNSKVIEPCCKARIHTVLLGAHTYVHAECKDVTAVEHTKSYDPYLTLSR